MNKNVLSLVLLTLIGCGSAEEAPSASAPQEEAAAPAPAVPIYDETFLFGSNTVCQEVIAGVSAKKPSSSSSALKIFDGATCAGTVLAALSEATITVFTDANGVSYELSGTNATGLSLHVLQY